MLEPFTDLDLDLLTDAMLEAEAAHRQQVPLEGGLACAPVGCSCGLTYRSPGWDASKRHLHEVAARALVGTLRRPCDSCFGSGLWHRLDHDYECPECDGRGATLTPLPPMTFQDHDGHTWVVDKLKARDDSPTWAQVAPVA